MINLNLVTNEEIVTHIRHLLKYQEREGLITHGETDCADLEQTLATLRGVEGGNLLIQAETKLCAAIESFLEPIDKQLFIWVETPWYDGDFSEIGLTMEEGLRLDPLYVAAAALMPQRPDSSDGYKSLTEGDPYGFVLGEVELTELIEVLVLPESQIHAKTLGIEELRGELIYHWNEVEKAVSTLELRELLTQLRLRRKHIALLYAVLCIDHFPDHNYERPRKIIDPRVIVFPILDERRFQDTLMEFSFNDLSHDTFEIMMGKFIDGLDEKHKDIPVFAEMYENMVKYSEMINQFRGHALWEPFLQSEGEWYRNAEMIMLCMKFSVESSCADHKDLWAIHESTDRFQAAFELWDLLTTNPFESIWFLRRGEIPTWNQWDDMLMEYSRPEQLANLKEIGARDYYEVACEADMLSRQYCSEILDDEEQLKMLRYYRDRLVSFYNVSDWITPKSLETEEE